MTRMIVGLLTSTLLLAGSASAQSTTAGPAATANKAPEKKVCRSEEVTGSMMASRVCHTRDQWAAIDAANKQAAASALEGVSRAKGY